MIGRFVWSRASPLVEWGEDNRGIRVLLLQLPTPPVCMPVAIATTYQSCSVVDNFVRSNFPLVIQIELEPYTNYPSRFTATANFKVERYYVMNSILFPLLSKYICLTKWEEC
ncbi:unnamed protein product [Taenia asiatica]|uniref:Uncharacterized protein n=1 Tax=Taenia asiatica TaxID=60517 RepID=A0A0R3WGF0_TAEAS|nr:unnamed protein product [Taenia asiatica]